MKKLSKRNKRFIECIINSIVTASLLLTALQISGNIDLPFVFVAFPLIIIGIGFIVTTMICIFGIIYELIQGNSKGGKEIENNSVISS